MLCRIIQISTYFLIYLRYDTFNIKIVRYQSNVPYVRNYFILIYYELELYNPTHHLYVRLIAFPILFCLHPYRDSLPEVAAGWMTQLFF